MLSDVFYSSLTVILQIAIIVHPLITNFLVLAFTVAIT